jgi:hypothetical protein
MLPSHLNCTNTTDDTGPSQISEVPLFRAIGTPIRYYAGQREFVLNKVSGKPESTVDDDDDDDFIYPVPSPRRYAGYNNYIYLCMYI